MFICLRVYQNLQHDKQTTPHVLFIPITRHTGVGVAHNVLSDMLSLVKPPYIKHNSWTIWETIITANMRWFSHIKDFGTLENEITELATTVDGIGNMTINETVWEIAKHFKITK